MLRCPYLQTSHNFADNKHPLLYLPSANEVCEGYVFTLVCLSLGWGLLLRGCLLRRGACSREGACSGGVETPCDGYCCGRYAFYWNAFLFPFFMPGNQDPYLVTTIFCAKRGTDPSYARVFCHSERN